MCLLATIIKKKLDYSFLYIIGLEDQFSATEAKTCTLVRTDEEEQGQGVPRAPNLSILGPAPLNF